MAIVQSKVLIFGPEPFLSTLNELTPFLKFNYFTDSSDINHDIILFHYDVLKDKKKKDFIFKSLSLKICASKEKKWSVKCDGYLLLPTTIYELNTLIENISAKQKFSKNSDITAFGLLWNVGTFICNVNIEDLKNIKESKFF